MKKICDFLRSNDRDALLSHHRPDGDAIGSCAALCRALRKIGKEAYFYPNPDLSQRYADLVEDLMADPAQIMQRACKINENHV